MEAVGPYAQAAKEREFLQGFLEGEILIAGHHFHLGETELAIVEASLQRIDDRESTLIFTQFPTDSLPLAITASYAYAQLPALGGDGCPLLILPTSGYVTKLDEFHYARTLNYESGAVDSVIPRKVVHALSEVPDQWGVFSAPTNDLFIFDEEECPHLGAMLVDLRRPEWSDRSFDSIWRFVEMSSDLPVVFYTQEMDAAASLVADRLESETLEVTNTLLATAQGDGGLSNSASDLTVEESILSNGGVDVTYVRVNDEKLRPMLSDLVQMKSDLQEREIEPLAVSRVFNLLTKQPFKPMYWTEQVKGDGYYNDIDTYLNLLKDKSDSAEGIAGDLLSNYTRKAREVQGYLNEHHRLQNTVFHAMQNAAEDGREVVFVVSNVAEREALITAATSEGYRIPESIQIIELAAIHPDPDSRHIFLFPPYSNSYLYRFPPSKEVAYVFNAFWANYVERASDEGLGTIQSTQTSQSIGGSGASGRVDDFVFDIDDVEDEIERRLEFNPMSLVAASSVGGAGQNQSNDGGSNSAETYLIHLSDGDTLHATPRQHITVYNTDESSINQTVAEGISVGDEILRISETADDIYDILIESVDSRQAMREHFKTVSDWREMLDAEMEARDLENSDVVQMLRERGSDLEQDSNAVAKWRTGERYGPGDIDDLRRTLQIFRPQIEDAALAQVTRVVWNSLKTIRDEHRRIGRDAQRILTAEANPSTSTTFRGSVNDALIRGKAKDIRQVAVIGIERIEGERSACR